MASERPLETTVNTLQEGREWRDYALELEKRAREWHEAAIPFSSFLRNVPQDQGGAIERIVMASDVLRIRAAVDALREILPKGATK